MVTGGFLNQDSYDLVGGLSVHGYEQVHLDIAFQGVTGIDPKFGFTVADEPDVVVARALKAASDRMYVIADHSKVSQVTFARFCGLGEVTGLITDDGISPQDCQSLGEEGLPVWVAGEL